MPSSQHIGDLEITGSLVVRGALDANIPPTNINVGQGSQYVMPLDRFRVWDAAATNLPGTPAADDLGLVNSSFGTAAPYIGTGDVKALGTTTRYARFIVEVPHEYVTERDIAFRFFAGMITTVAATSCVLDCEAFLMSHVGTAYASTDVISTAAQSINSLVFSAKDFVVDPAVFGGGLVPGLQFDLRVTITAIDAAGVAAVIGAILKAVIVCTTRP